MQIPLEIITVCGKLNVNSNFMHGGWVHCLWGLMAAPVALLGPLLLRPSINYIKQWTNRHAAAVPSYPHLEGGYLAFTLTLCLPNNHKLFSILNKTESSLLNLKIYSVLIQVLYTQWSLLITLYNIYIKT